MSHLELRKKFFAFWEQAPRNHVEIPSSSLVPENDQTTLFISAGMQPLIPYLKGQTHPQGKRLVDIQPSLRLQDIEEVGDNRHTTFFEMLGNWSLGDYFKKEQLPWCWEFFTKELRIDSGKLYVSVFEGTSQVPKDEESLTIWKKLGIPKQRIYFYSVKKNWWSNSGTPEEMLVGDIGGPDSEIFYDFGEELKFHENSPFKNENCHPNCDCGRFMEIGNSVFIQYIKKEDGSLEELPQKSVDFGGGLERILAVVNKNPDIFQTDVLEPIVKKISERAGYNYGTVPERDKSIRIIADHLRAAVMLIKDGVAPSNKLQGYVLRRLIRRALSHRQDLFLTIGGVEFSSLVEDLITIYPELKSDWEKIASVLDEEYKRFDATYQRGKKKLLEAPHVDGKLIFDLHQTEGFPFELTIEELRRQGKEISAEERRVFEKEFTKHQELSRTASAGMFKGGLADHSEIVTKYHTATHLLQAALRKILGEHVHQEGSNITAERLRFDFSQPQKLTHEEIKKVEEIVNSQIAANLPRKVETLAYDEAIKSGALAFFKERYPEKVTVYSFGPFSREICGGPHVENTKVLGKFTIIKEEAVASGIRRIYAELK